MTGDHTTIGYGTPSGGRVAGTYPVPDPSPAAGHAGGRHAQADLPRREPQARLRDDTVDQVVVRNGVVDAMFVATRAHAQHAWEAVHGPLSANAVFFLYRDPVTARPPAKVYVAVRWQPAGPEAEQLPMLLAGLARNAVDRQLRGRFDSRRDLAVTVDDMPGDAVYAGIAASTLDTPHGRWDTVRGSLAHPWSAPSRCFVHLGDGTRILLDRNGPHLETSQLIQATKTLDVHGNAVRPWRSAPKLAREPDTRQVWWLLELLDLAVAGQPHE